MNRTTVKLSELKIFICNQYGKRLAKLEAIKMQFVCICFQFASVLQYADDLTYTFILGRCEAAAAVFAFGRS